MFRKSAVRSWWLPTVTKNWHNGRLTNSANGSGNGRERWHVPKLPVREALRRGEEAGDFPVIVADHADNTGGGSPGDSTEVLQTFLDLKLQDALILYMVDESVARQTHDAGVGSRVAISLGGKSSPVQGPPVETEAEVLAISDGPFAYDGPMFAGLTGSMGTSAWLKIDGVNIVVVTAREQPVRHGLCTIARH